MKLKNTKKYYQKRIVKGMRHYLPLYVKYSDLGITTPEFISIKVIESLLDLKFSGEDSGFVDHYNMLDYNTTNNNQPLNVNLRFDRSYYLDILQKQYPNIAYVERNGVYYYIEGVAGYKNPKYEYENDEDYWLYNDDDNLKQTSFYYENENKDENIIKLLTYYANTVEFRKSFFSGNLFFKILSGRSNDKNNSFFKKLSYLCKYCKTTYEDFYDDYVKITFAIRYSHYVEPFLSDLKQIIKHYIIKL